MNSSISSSYSSLIEALRDVETKGSISLKATNKKSLLTPALSPKKKISKSTVISTNNDLNAMLYDSFVSTSSLHQVEKNVDETSKIINDILKDKENCPSNPNLQMPKELLDFKRDWNEATHKMLPTLPILRQLSPKSQRKISSLPPANESETKMIDKIQNDICKVSITALQDKLYRNILQVSDKNINHSSNTAAITRPNTMQDTGFSAVVDESAGKYYRDISGSIERRSKRDQIIDEENRCRKKQQSLPPFYHRPAVSINPQSESQLLTFLEGKTEGKLKHKLSSIPSRTMSGKAYYPNHASTNLNASSLPRKVHTAPESPAKQRHMSSQQHLSQSNDFCFDSKPVCVSPTPTSPTGIYGNVEGGSIRQIHSSHGYKDDRISATTIARAKDILLDHYIPVMAEEAIVQKDIVSHYEEERIKSLNHVKVQARNKLRMEDELNALCAVIYDSSHGDVNLNPTYNTFRLYSRGCMILIYYVNIFKLRSAFSHLKYQISLVNMYRRLAAGNRVKRIGRGMLARMRVREMRRIIAVRKEMEERLRRRRVAQISLFGIARCATRLWLHCKRVLKARKRRFMRAVCMVQRVNRGRIGRQIGNALRAIRDTNRSAAICIQCSYRQRLARRRCVVHRKIKIVMEKYACLLLLMQQKKSHRQQTGAVMTINRYVKCYVIRKKMKFMLYWHHQECVIKIQKNYRCYITRKRFLRTIKLVRFQRSVNEKAVVVVQKHIRARIDRLMIRELKRAKLIEKQQRIAAKKLLVTPYWHPSLWGRALLRALVPFRYNFIWKKALTIQRCYRSYRHGRKRRYIVSLQTIYRNFLRKQQLKLKAVLMMQCLYRGYRYRYKSARSKRMQYIIAIQCFWRLHFARRLVKTLIKERAAGLVLGRNMRPLLMWRRYIKIKNEAYRVNKYVVKIQRLWYRYRGRRMLQYRKVQVRALHEQTRSYTDGLNRLLSGVQLKILIDSMKTNIGAVSSVTVMRKEYPEGRVHHEPCPCLGPVQSLFVAAVGARGRVTSDRKVLMTNKLDAVNFNKFMAHVDGLCIHERPSKKRDVGTNSSSSSSSCMFLLNAIKCGLIQIPAYVKKLSSSDVEIAFSEAKIDASSGNSLSYQEFLRSLKILADYAYDQRRKMAGASRKRRDGVNNSTSIGTSIDDSNDDDDDDGGGDSNDDVTKRRMKKRRGVFPVRASLIHSIDDLQRDHQLIMTLQLLVSEVDEEWLAAVMQWMNKEAMARLGKYATIIQGMYRLVKSSKIKELMKLSRQSMALLVDQYNASVIIQSCMRRFVGRRRVAHVAQKFLRHYLPPDRDEYWYNPSTRITKYTKPKVLLHYNCVSIMLPPKGCEYLVNCFYCAVTVASLNCIECEESFCSSCYSNLHCKGSRKDHRTFMIPFCSNCQLQMAAKSCLTCILQKPPRGSLQETMKESERGTLCDVCFTHLHDVSEKSIKDTALKKQRMMLAKSSDSHIVTHHMQMKVMTKHKYDFLVQPCDECTFRGASWRCHDCDQLYCHVCLTGLHSFGVFKKHKAVMLSYYSPEIHKHYIADVINHRQHHKLEAIHKLALAKREVFTAEAYVRIQTWWRQIYYGRRGKALMRSKRLKNRRLYFVKQQQNHLRNQLSYRVLDVFGMAPTLRSDSREERILKQVSLLHRRRAREHIWKNKEDYAWYLQQQQQATPSVKPTPIITATTTGDGDIVDTAGVADDSVDVTKPRKGEPRLSFDVGTEEELLDQAKNGGYRLPGVIHMQYSKGIHTTSRSLVGIIKPGYIVRVGKQLFAVLKVTATDVTFDRRWRSKSSKAGKVMYRLPSFNRETGRIETILRYKSYDYIVNNYIVQAGLHYHGIFCGTVEHCSSSISRYCAKNGLGDSAQDWKHTAKVWSERKKWSSALLQEGQIDVNMSSSKDKPMDVSVSVLVDGKTPNAGGSYTSVGTGNAAIVLDAMGDEVRDTEYITQLKQRIDFNTLPFSPSLIEDMLLAIRCRKQGERFYFTGLEQAVRAAEEAKMSLEEVSRTADDWVVNVDIITENIYYVNRHTNEMMNEMPSGIYARNKLAENAKKEKALYDTANASAKKWKSSKDSSLSLKSRRV